MTPEQLIDQWRVGLRIAHRAHFEASKSYKKMHLLLAIPTITISALLGTTVFAHLQYSDVAWVKIALALLSVTMIVLSTLQSFLRYAEIAERHQAAATQIGEVRRELEQHLVFEHRDEPAFEALREKWNAADRQAPTIPSHIYNAALAEVRAEEKERAR